MKDYIKRFAANFGINDIQSPGRMPNTRRALAIAEFARDRGKLDEFRSLTMDAHWIEGRDIEDDNVLRKLALNAGLDPEEAMTAAEDPRYLKRVDNIRAEYKKVGVGGIPTFVFDGEKIEGCQPYEVIRSAALRAGTVSK